MRKFVILLLIAGVVSLAYLYVFKPSKSSNISNSSDSKLSLYTTPVKVGNTEVLVEIANTGQSRAKGLSGRNSLCETCGMLFDFGAVDIIPTFWMKDMLIPIDIIWINDGRVIGIEKNVPPEPGKSDTELSTYSPPGIIDYVLEVNADFSEKQSVQVGQSVIFP